MQTSHLPFSKFLAFCLLLLASVTPVFCAEADPEEDPAKAIEYPSPNGRFAFRYRAATETEPKAYLLIEKASGKVLQQIAEADLEPSPSARFSMTVLWRPDSKAFALTALFGKRGSTLLVFRHDGAMFQELKLPELYAEIPEKAKAGRRFQHILTLNSQSATRWQKDGSLLVEIENAKDGEGGTITAKRNVTLGFDASGKAKILKSTTKIKLEAD